MTWRAGIGLAIAALAVCGVATAQPVTVAIPPRWLSGIPPLGAPPPPEGRARAGEEQLWAMVGREDRIAPQDKPACAIADVDPLEAIARAAAEAQVVIINEAHDSPRDRAFIADVAVRLSDLGFDTYAAETLAHPVKPRAATDAPRLGDGWYSQEPMFGALLRAVQREGYALVGYEDQDRAPPAADFVDDLNRREAAQASNLINRVFLDRRDAKVLIHVGYAHNDEEIARFPGAFLRPREVRWMARRLKDILGVDPLTIDQTTFTAARPGVCVTDAAGGVLPRGRDLHIAHPPLTFDRQRPTWRDDTGARAVEIPRRLQRANERIIVEARAFSDPPDAVPADRVLVDPGESIPLLLAPGRYKARAWTQDGKVSPDVTLTVRPAPRPPAVTRVNAAGATP
ncbi:MAG: hypothetical protein NW200_14010 [Hyphomonadaceae bacterium]|nr:hypothetical protein [Hyphomonadaceae bacterium]